jgi:transposase
MEKEGTTALSKAERLQRSKAYKGLSKEERANTKAEFDANMKPRVTRCHMLRMHPTPRQHAWLMRWFKDTRTTYNLAMGRVLDRKLHTLPPAAVKLGELEKELQTTLVSAKGVKEHLTPRHSRLLRTPKVLRQQAIKSVIAVLKGHHTRVLKQEKLHQLYPDARAFQTAIKFNPGLKSKKMRDHDSFCVEACSLKIIKDDAVSLYKLAKSHKGGDYLFRSIRTQKGLVKLSAAATAQDFKVHYRHGKLYLILPERQLPKVRARVPDGGEAVAAVDPGVRTAFTVYSPQGSVVELGTNAYQVLDKLRDRTQRAKMKLQWVGHWRQTDTNDHSPDREQKKRQRQRLRLARNAYHESEDKAKRVVRDFHYKAAHYLLQRYHTILLPCTSSHKWREGRKLHASTKRRAMMLRHGKFAERLVQTATQYEGSKVLRGSEAYTSKQCGACGVLNDKLGGSKVFTCRSCGATGDRDIHAARNILLRFLN